MTRSFGRQWDKAGPDDLANKLSRDAAEAAPTPVVPTRRFCDPPTTHRYEPVMTADGRAFTSRIRCKRCGYEREG